MQTFVLSAFADEIDSDLKLQMDTLEKHQICHIEMRGVNGKNITEHSLQEVKKIKKQLDDRGFRISAIGSPIGKIQITDDFSSHLDLFKHTLEIADILEAPFIRMFSFYMPKGKKTELYKDEVLERWYQFLKAAKGTDIILLHENEKEIYGDIPERCLELVNNMNSSQMKLIFDPANFIQCDVDTIEAYELLKEEVIYFHIKDANYADHQVVPVGYGDGQVQQILTKAYQNGFKGFLSLEPHLGSFIGLSKLEQGNLKVKKEQSGPEKFAIATNALKNILKEIKG
ncbi:MAG: sugar phosphate isomerase/epimerase [Epulopiscium sp.]|nr:sugar phosphate isomerase/epimerase [Candidatus Epulonipiscium sp.]